MVDVLAAPQQAKSDAEPRTLALISTAHWVSHFHLMVLPTDRNPQTGAERSGARLLQP